MIVTSKEQFISITTSFSSFFGNLGTIELLLFKGGNPRTLNRGRTVPQFAVDALMVMLDHHAVQPKVTLNDTDCTPLASATVACSLKCVKVMIEVRDVVDGIMKMTPLMIAATASYTDQSLVLGGADDMDSYECTGREIASSGKRGDVEILFVVTSPILKALKDTLAWRMMGPGWAKACCRETMPPMLLKVSRQTRKGLNPSRSKDVKSSAKHSVPSNKGQQGQGSSNFSKNIGKGEDEPWWAPLPDTYMLKDWDKAQDSDVAEPSGVSLDNYADDE